MRERLFSDFEIKFADGETPGTFEGYGAIFGNVDQGGDMIVKGAFRDTLRDWNRRKSLPKMLVQHGGWAMSDRDGLPVGKWTAMSEDDKGLYVKGRLINLDLESGKALYGAMKEGVLDGLSIGYRAKEFALGTKPDEPRRTLKKVDLFEISIVTFPMNQDAGTTLIKSIADMTIRDLEDGLINGTLPPIPAQVAKAILADGYKSIRHERDAMPDCDKLAQLLRKNINILT